jgi:hypothetical protein
VNGASPVPRAAWPACGVSLGDEGGAQVPVLDGQSDQPVGPACDVPGQGPAEAGEADVPVRVSRDDLAGQAVAGRFMVGPGHEVFDPFPECAHFQGPGVPPFHMQVMGVMIEQEVPVRDHALQDPDGVDHRGDGNPGNVAFGTAGMVVALFVGSVLVLVAVDQVPYGPATGTGNGIGTASGAQAQDYWWRVVIRSVHYSLLRKRRAAAAVSSIFWWSRDDRELVTLQTAATRPFSHADVL